MEESNDRKRTHVVEIALIVAGLIAVCVVIAAAVSDTGLQAAVESGRIGIEPPR